MALVEEELTRKIKGCFFDVHNQVGLGLPEKAYQEGLIRAFAARGIAAESKPPIKLKFHNQDVLELEPDFIVEGRVVLELKALREGFAQEHFVQLFSYLKATRIRLGFLVNFGLERVVDRRILFDEKPLVIDENWDHVKGCIQGRDKDTLTMVRETILDVGHTHGLGYGDSIYRKLCTAGLGHAGSSTNTEPRAEPRYNDIAIGTFPVDCIVVDSSIVCLVMALKDGLDMYDVTRTRSYIQNLGLRFGVVANFGKNRLEIRGVAVDRKP